MKKTFLSQLLVAGLCLISSCSPGVENSVPQSNLSLSWTTELSNDTPEFVVPGKSIELLYAAVDTEKIDEDNLPKGWSAVIDPQAKKLQSLLKKRLKNLPHLP